MKKITLALIGAGDRGMYCYAPYVAKNSWRAEFVAVSELDPRRRRDFAEAYHVPEEQCFDSFDELLARPRLADALMICTPDPLHFDLAMRAMKLGYHILLEKPMAIEPAQCVRLAKASQQYDRVMILCYVLRYTEFFLTLKRLIAEGRIGDVVALQLNENIPLLDQTHAFTRGRFRHESVCPILTSHCCHDLDIITWLMDSPCKEISSFGALTHFKAENAPEGAPTRCMDGCPHQDSCLYYAPDIYLTDSIEWPTSTLGADMSLEARRHVLETTTYGQCIYRCDNTVADNQVVMMNFESGSTAVFSLCPFTGTDGRSLKVMGTTGEIRADMATNAIEIYDLASGRKDTVSLKPSAYKYGGGDYGIMDYFVRQVAAGASGGRSSMQNSLESHLMAFAAEEARQQKQVINMKAYRDSLEL